MKWMVSAKSGTSFDRETRKRSGITLPLSVPISRTSIQIGDIRNKACQQPRNRQCAAAQNPEYPGHVPTRSDISRCHSPELLRDVPAPWPMGQSKRTRQAHRRPGRYSAGSSCSAGMVQLELEGGLGAFRLMSMWLNRLIAPVGTTRKRTAMQVYPAKLTH